MAAVHAARFGKSVIVFEKNERTGRKLRITGKGRCNVTNNSSMEEHMKNIPVNPRFLYSSYSSFCAEETMAFFEELGVPLKTERGNRVFPVSDKASDVTGGLTRRLHELGVNIHLGCDRKDILCEEIEGGSKKTVSGIIFKDGTVEKADTVEPLAQAAVVQLPPL